MKLYELWDITDPKNHKRVSGHSTLVRLKRAWSKAIKKGVLEARALIGDSYVIINDQMPLHDPHMAMGRFSSIDKWNKQIVNEAIYFTVIRFHGVGVYERHEKPNKKEAVQLAEELSLESKGNFLVYAVNKQKMSALVRIIKYADIKRG